MSFTFVPQEAISQFEQGKSITEVYRMGVLNKNGTPASRRSVERWHQAWNAGHASPEERSIPGEIEEKTTVREEDDSLVIETTSARIKSYEDLIAVIKPDLSVWEPVDHYVTTYEGMRAHKRADLVYTDGRADGWIKDDGKLTVVTMWSVHAKFRRRQAKPFEEVMDNIIDRLRKASPRPAFKLPKPKGDHLFLPGIIDVHIGKQSATFPWTISQAAEEFVKVGEALIDRAVSTGFRIDQIVFPFGNDALHADNQSNMTTSGTWLEVSGNYRDAVDAACYAHIEYIKRLAEIAPVVAIEVDGNHDANSAYWLGKTLEAYFSKWSTVSVELNRRPRKYFTYGKNLLGFYHGDKREAKPAELALLMSEESPDWSATTYRMFYRGNWHKKEGMYHPIVSEKGVIIETLPALCPMDTWHEVRGYVGNKRAAEARLFHKEYGPAGVWPVFADELK